MTMQTVLNFKETLEKELPEIKNVERCKDVLERLRECEMTLEILAETLIGATVNKMKMHKEVGATAKALIKSWKLVAASAQPSGGGKRKPAENPKTAETAKKTAVDKRGSLESNGSFDERDDANYDPTAEWSGLPDQRNSVCSKLFQILLASKPALKKEGVNEAAVLHLIAPRTAEIESAIHTKSSNDRRAYADKARSIFFNLKKNQPLALSLLLGHVEPVELVSFSAEQLASDEIRLKREETAQRLIESKRLDWNEANEDKINDMCGIKGDLLNASLFTCSRCKSVKTTSTQKQTRSADEPMTVFVLCLNCGKRWKC